MSLYCLISYLLVCHKKAFFVCCAVDVIKASLFGLLTANSKICSERFHSHIFSPLSNVCGLSDKAGWIHNALTKIPFKRENGIECHSITADGKHGNTLTQKAFTLTYTKQQRDSFFGALSPNICTVLAYFQPEHFKSSPPKCTHLFDFIPFHHLSKPKVTMHCEMTS